MTGAAIYLDHAATTPPRPEVVARIAEVLADAWGNPSSVHGAGRRARAVLDDARDETAAALATESRAIVFTSGGTEAINLAVKGAAWAGKGTGHRIVTTGVEHEAVLNAARFLERFGFEVVVVPVDAEGRPDPDRIVAAVDERTVLVSLQLANNEVGTIVPVADLVARIRRSGPRVPVHVDAVQAAPWMAIDPAALDIDLLSLSGHKLEGPKGVGVLWIRPGAVLLPQLHGGGQERYRRAGTENVAGAAGLARALALSVSERKVVLPRVRAARDRLRDGLLAVPRVRLTGPAEERLPNHLSLLVEGLRGSDLVVALDLAGIAASTGAACSSGSEEPSHVLLAMGVSAAEAASALRLTLGRRTEETDVDAALRIVPAAVARLRGEGTGA